MEVTGISETVSTDAVLGTNTIPNGTAAGVHGVSKNAGPGVLGESVDGRGVQGLSTNNYGIRAHSVKSAGLWATSAEGRGIEGNSTNFEGVAGGSVNGNAIWGKTTKGSGVLGESASGAGVTGSSETGRGVAGFSKTGQAIYGQSSDQAGVVGISEKFVGVWGESKNVDQPGVFGKGKLAARFDGDVEVTGIITAKNNIHCLADIHLLNADFAEDFDVKEQSEPGEIMVLTETGILEPCTKAYDKKVVGVISGAGNYKPAIILDKQNNSCDRKPIAMMGKVYCKVDADISAIETGDMLTTSDVTGYAMKAVDPFKSFGAVIGKAMASLQSGKGLIPMLVVLQ